NNKDIPVYIANKIKISNSFLMGLYNEKIFVSKPTLDNLTSLQLEAVLGHELGHKYYKTSFINMIFALSSLILYYFSGKYISDKKLIILFSMIFILGIITFIILRRTHEFLADKYSYKKLKDSSYLIEALSIMEETNKKNGFTNSRAILHPKLEKRIKKLESYNV
ncbi:MAG: M48 family metalloprotease, partial [Oscillospiraceae bacterium]